MLIIIILIKYIEIQCSAYLALRNLIYWKPNQRLIHHSHKPRLHHQQRPHLHIFRTRYQKKRLFSKEFPLVVSRESFTSWFVLMLIIMKKWWLKAKFEKLRILVMQSAVILCILYILTYFINIKYTLTFG